MRDGSPTPSTTERRLHQLYVGVRVGPYKLANVEGKIYVGHDCGEGGTFTAEQLLPYLEEFFREHF